MTWRHTKAIGEIGFLFAEGRQPENCSACPGRETEKQEELIHFGEKRPSTAVNYFALSEPANLCLVACRSQWPDPAPPSSSSTVWCCGRLGDVNCSIKGRWPEASGIHCARCNHLRTSQLRLNVMSWILSGRQKSPTGVGAADERTLVEQFGRVAWDPVTCEYALPVLPVPACLRIDWR